MALVSTTIGYHQFLMDEAHISDDADDVDGGYEGSAWNWSAADNETYEEPYEGPEWLVVPLVFGLIFIVGVVGNGTLIFTVLVNKNMRTTPNVLLVSRRSMVSLDRGRREDIFLLAIPRTVFTDSRCESQRHVDNLWQSGSMNESVGDVSRI